MIDLTKTDTYDFMNFPTESMEITLKTIRTLRNICLMPGSYSATGVAAFSHMHELIHAAAVALLATGEEKV